MGQRLPPFYFLSKRKNILNNKQRDIDTEGHLIGPGTTQTKIHRFKSYQVYQP